jgi:putative phosphoesterase
MKIGIVSDTHNNITNFRKALEWLNKEGILLVLHCGDIQNQETIDEASKIFKGEIRYVRGNADHDLPDIPNTMEIEFNHKKIAFAHFPEIAKRLAQTGKFDLVFYGHTHRAWDEVIGNCHFINPGEMAGQFYKPTFAVYDTNTNVLELKILERL